MGDWRSREDFAELALLQGPPPKVIWTRLGNCSTRDIAALLRPRTELLDFADQQDAALLGLP